MAELRNKVIAKSNVTSQNVAKGSICRAEVLRIIYERKARFSDRVRSSDIDNILEALNLRHSEAQTVENMIRGHRRKGFVDPPKPLADEAETEKPKNSPKKEEKKQRSPSPIMVDCDLDVTPPTALPTAAPVTEMRNKRLFDSSGFHDPKSALQPAKIRFRKMKSTHTIELSENSSNEFESFNDSQSSPNPTVPLSSAEEPKTLAEQMKLDQKQPTTAPLSPTKLETEGAQPSSPPQDDELPSLKRSRRIKITPRREILGKPSEEKAIECPKIAMPTPIVTQPSIPYTCSQQNMILAQYQPTLGQAYILPQNLYQTSAIAQLLIHQQMFAAQQYSLQQYFTPLLIQQPQNALKNFFQSYTP